MSHGLTPLRLRVLRDILRSGSAVSRAERDDVIEVLGDVLEQHATRLAPSKTSANHLFQDTDFGSEMWLRLSVQQLFCITCGRSFQRDETAYLNIHQQIPRMLCTDCVTVEE